MPFTLHPDAIHIFIYATPFIDRGVWDIYPYIRNYYQGVDYVNYYDPFAYYVVGFWSWVCGLIVGQDYYKWIYGTWDMASQWTAPLLFRLPGAENKFLVLTLWKSLYLIADLLILFFMQKTQIGNKDDRALFFKFWAINPILLYSVYMFGQFDILPTVLVCAALLFAGKREGLKWSALAISCSVPFKLYSLILLPFPILLAGAGFKERAQVWFFSVFPLLCVYLPLGLHSDGEVFWHLTSGFAFGKSQSAAWPWMQVFAMALKGTVYLFILAHAAGCAGNREPFRLLASYFLIALLALLTPPNVPHYFVWVTPFVGLFLVRNPDFYWKYFLAVFFVFVATLSGPQTFIGLLAPVHPEFFMSFPGWMDIAFRVFPSGIYRDISSLMVVVLLFWMIFKEISRLKREFPSGYVDRFWKRKPV